MPANNYSLPKVTAALLLGYTCATAWVVYADIVYHNQVPLEAFEFHGLYPISLGLSAIAAGLLFGRSLRGLGFNRFRLRWLMVPLAIALVTLAIPFGINLLTGTVGLNSKPAFDGELMKVGIPVLLILAVGEEVMWRGVLYGELSKKYSFTTTSLIIGLFWTLWHLPVIIHTKFIYADRPLWFALVLFPVNVVALSFIYNYLRRASGSIWPCVLLHAFTNYFAFVLIAPLEQQAGPMSVFFVNDIGICYVLTNVAGAALAIRYAGRTQSAVENQQRYT